MYSKKIDFKRGNHDECHAFYMLKLNNKSEADHIFHRVMNA